MIRFLRNLLRLLVIVRTLARHGALPADEFRDAAPGIAFLFRRMNRSRVEGRPGQRLARALQELGPSFIKLGQALSTRADLVGDAMAEDLAELRDRLPPFPGKAARAIVEAELGRPIEVLFARFDDSAVAAASIAQVHYAETPGGRRVAVKVLRPGIELAFRRDIDLMYWLAGLILRVQPRLRRLKPVEVVDTFADTVAMEMDLRMEGRRPASCRTTSRTMPPSTFRPSTGTARPGGSSPWTGWMARRWTGWTPSVPPASTRTGC